MICLVTFIFLLLIWLFMPNANLPFEIYIFLLSLSRFLLCLFCIHFMILSRLFHLLSSFVILLLNWDFENFMLPMYYLHKVSLVILRNTFPKLSKISHLTYMIFLSLSHDITFQLQLNYLTFFQIVFGIFI